MKEAANRGGLSCNMHLCRFPVSAGTAQNRKNRIRSNHLREAWGASRSPCSRRRTGRRRSAWSRPPDDGIPGKLGSIQVASAPNRPVFKLGHSHFDNRPLTMETGQYPPPRCCPNTDSRDGELGTQKRKRCPGGLWSPDNAREALILKFHQRFVLYATSHKRLVNDHHHNRVVRPAMASSFCRCWPNTDIHENKSGHWNITGFPAVFIRMAMVLLPRPSLPSPAPPPPRRGRFFFWASRRAWGDCG